MLFILGYPFNCDTIPSNLIHYESIEQADYESEEWCKIEAKTLNEARLKFENQFIQWQQSFK